MKLKIKNYELTNLTVQRYKKNLMYATKNDKFYAKRGKIPQFRYCVCEKIAVILQPFLKNER